MKRALLLLAMFTVLCRTALGAVWYVDKDNVSGTEDGTSWATASITIQEGVDAAFADGGGEVWVAEGTYDEERANDTGSLIMVEEVHLYGGFAGDETAREQRDWESFVTTIDGSTARGGEPAYHVVIGADNATLDGFTITGGNAHGNGTKDHGGGMYNYDSSPTVTNCVFTGNTCTQRGGGMYNGGNSSSTVTDCLFQSNSAPYGGNWGSGGGMFNGGSGSPMVINCIFRNNSVGGGGGGMYNASSGSPTISNCTFEGNSAQNGGGMANTDFGSPTVTGCTFYGNVAATGGAVHTWHLEMLEVTNCTFVGNEALVYGGAMDNYNASFTITNCTFQANSAGTGGGGMSNGNCTVSLVNCTFHGNSAREGAGGMSNWSYSLVEIKNCIIWGDTPQEILSSPSSSPVVTYSDIQGGFEGEGNIDADPLFAGAVGGDLRLRAASPCIDTGTASGAPSTDAFGIPRPQGAGVDMGAYEFPGTEHDSDGDTIPDVIEGEDDPDGDSLSNDQDVDSDGDGVPDLDEGIGDPDDDGIPNFLDLDSDGNDIADAVEGADDPDGDGVPNIADEDNDGDGRTDWYEGTADPDGDGIPSYLDPDSNGDGVPDAAEPVIVYVDKDNLSGIRDGFSWATALGAVQDGLDLAARVGRNEVWVAEGIYNELQDNDSGSLIMIENVHIYGGFAGTETSRDQRDWQTHVTVIDGATARDGEAAYHVVIGADDATLDAFTITGGDANAEQFWSPGEPGVCEERYGAGMYNFNASPTVTNCTFQSNSALNSGGGMYNSWSYPTLTKCTFENNSASGGGGMFNVRYSSPALTRCTFRGNSASGGGGMRNYGGSPTLIDCSFEDNSAEYTGGGMHNDSQSWPVLTRCTFQDNSAPYGGGMFNGDAWPTLTDCTFTGNTADWAGGAMYNYNYYSFYYPGPTVTDCLFAGNSTDGEGGAIYNDVGQWPAISNCTFVDNTAVNGGGMYTSSMSDLADTFEGFVRNCTFSGNMAEQDGGGMYLYGPPPRDTWDEYDAEDAITVGPTDCTFTDNQADRGGGMCVGIDRESEWLPNVARCYFQGNAARLGGGMFSEMLERHHGDPSVESMVTNCVFAHNTAQEAGAGMYNLWVSPRVTNCTLSRNTATSSGGAIANFESASPVVLNCIFWGDSPEEIANLDGTSIPIVTFSDIQGGYSGDGNIDLDPLFVDPSAGDFRLQPGSPCIDSGTSEGAPETDIMLIPRPQGAVVDMGAYEFTAADSDGDTIPDTYEGGYDPDGDEIPNYLDTDSDDDGLSDEEEVDTYGTDPTDTDSDGDGMPDGWEVDNAVDPLADDSSEDPDGDGLTNLEEYANGTDPQGDDSDGDGMPDGWEMDNSLDPLVDDAAGDNDSDGLTNLDEYSAATNPNDPDTDGDGFTDGAEVAQDSDPNDPSSFPMSRGGSGEPCFIATAAYGTPAAREVGVLCEFRDRYLLTNRAGTALVRTYYRLSPPVARFIAARPGLRTAVRAILAPVVALVELTAVTPQVLTLMALGGLLLARRSRMNLSVQRRN